MTDLEPIAARIEAIVEELDELAFDRLREAVGDGATERPELDKRLTQARRALEKAARPLRTADDD